MRLPKRFYRFEPGDRLPFDSRKLWSRYERPQTYTRLADAECRLREALDGGWYPNACLYVTDAEWRAYPKVNDGSES